MEEHTHFVHVLQAYPLQTTRPIISSLISFLDNEIRNRQKEGADWMVPLLGTNQHVSWVLEVTGACLTLPIEDVDLMTMAVNLLSRWYFFSLISSISCVADVFLNKSLF